MRQFLSSPQTKQTQALVQILRRILRAIKLQTRHHPFKTAQARIQQQPTRQMGHNKSQRTKLQMQHQTLQLSPSQQIQLRKMRPIQALR